jgi:hypothetical protein
MKFTSVFNILCLVTTAAAWNGGISKRQSGTAVDLLAKLGVQLDDLGKKIPLYNNGDSSTAVTILDGASLVLNTMKSAEEVLANGSTLGLPEALALVLPSYQISVSISTLMGVLIGKKGEFDPEFSTVVADHLTLFNEEARRLVSIITGKLPQYLPAALAVPFYQPILDKLEEATKAFHAEQSKLANEEESKEIVR